MPNRRVLFVDDNIMCALDTCEALKGHGYSVVEVHQARDALRVLENHGRLCALVTDVELGPGENGFELARAARAAYPQLPVVFISGTAGARHPTEGVEGSQFVAKPYHPRQIEEALDRALGLEAA